MEGSDEARSMEVRDLDPGTFFRTVSLPVDQVMLILVVVLLGDVRFWDALGRRGGDDRDQRNTDKDYSDSVSPILEERDMSSLIAWVRQEAQLVAK